MKIDSPKDHPFSFIYQSDVFNNSIKYAIPPFPLLIDFETTNFCNLKCIFCNQNIMKRKKGMMEFITFKKAVDEIAEKSSTKAIKFGLWGEPFLNKSFRKMLEYAKNKGLIIHVITNGLFLHQKDVWQHIDMLNISMQGLTKEEYQRLRNYKEYDKLVKNIKYVAFHDKRPYINLSVFILDETEEEVDSFKLYWKNIVDSVGIGKTHITRLGDKAPKDLIKRQTASIRKKPCNQVRTRLSIYWDGTVSVCCGDFETELSLGNINDFSIEDIWNGKKINQLRRVLSSNDWSSIPFCTKCNHRF